MCVGLSLNLCSSIVLSSKRVAAELVAWAGLQVWREILRERQGVLRARKGRSYGDEAPRQRKFWEATVQPKPAEEYNELLSNADDLVHAPTAINAELMECQDVTEILDIVTEEAAIMTGENAALALMRLVNLSRSELHRLRHGPAFHKLLYTLDKHIDELGPKVIFYPSSTFWKAGMLLFDVFQLPTLITSIAFIGIGPDFVEPGKGQTQPT